MCGQQLLLWLLSTHHTVSPKMTAPAQLSAHLNVLFKWWLTKKIFKNLFKIFFFLIILKKILEVSRHLNSAGVVAIPIRKKRLYAGEDNNHTKMLSAATSYFKQHIVGLNKEFSKRQRLLKTTMWNQNFSKSIFIFQANEIINYRYT